MTLDEELAADQPALHQCKTCLFLSTLSPADRVDWQSSIRNRSYSGASLARAINRRSDVPVAESSVKRHRENHQ